MTAPLQPQAECSELPFWRVGELADREYRLVGWRLSARDRLSAQFKD